MLLFNRKVIFRISGFAKILDCITLLLPICYLCSFFYNTLAWKNACNKQNIPIYLRTTLISNSQMDKQTKKVRNHAQKEGNNNSLTAKTTKWVCSLNLGVKYNNCCNLVPNTQKISVAFKLSMPLKIWEKKSACFPRKPSQGSAHDARSLLNQTLFQNSFVCEFCFYKHWSMCLMLVNYCSFQNTRVLERGRELLKGYFTAILFLSCELTTHSAC